ncbi:MAG TPA: hypothetical protein VJL89_10320, partial [Thermodesulfovibrionia bacterium]|nr:hypothetical protein [Thermodesulfovibrionia bacterium]
MESSDHKKWFGVIFIISLLFTLPVPQLQELIDEYVVSNLGLGLRFGHLGKLIVSTFYKKSYYFSMLHDMDKVLIKKVAET